jgi:hypothetical protein
MMTTSITVVILGTTRKMMMKNSIKNTQRQQPIQSNVDKNYIDPNYNSSNNEDPRIDLH